LFQHTAARRRLVPVETRSVARLKVSTHSRPKAAGKAMYYGISTVIVSTHSRPKAAGVIYSFLSIK